MVSMFALKVYVILPFDQRETSFATFCLLSWMMDPSRLGFTLGGQRRANSLRVHLYLQGRQK